jgi:carnosine N-methyltransferase
MEFYEIEQAELDQHIQGAKKEGRNPEKINVGQALKHYVRDWSLEGDAERSDAFPCVLNTLLGLSEPNRTVPAKVLVPGSGVGRLGHDIHNLGGECHTVILMGPTLF